MESLISDTLLSKHILWYYKENKLNFSEKIKFWDKIKIPSRNYNIYYLKFDLFLE